MRRGGDDGPVVVLGAEDYRGRYLCRWLAGGGREVVAVGTAAPGAGEAMFLPWDGAGVGPWAMALEGAAALVEFPGPAAGADATAVVGRAIAGCRLPPRAWLHVGTTAVYGRRHARPACEWDERAGTGPVARLASGREDALFGCALPGRVRKLALRVAPVLVDAPGAPWDLLARLSRLGGGWRRRRGLRMGWIHIEDFLAAAEWLLGHGHYDGWVNLCAPSAPEMGEFLRAVRRQAGVRIGLRVPGRVADFVRHRLGQVEGIPLEPVWATPGRLLAGGFRFRWPDPEPALADLAQRVGIGRFFAGCGRDTGGGRFQPGSGGENRAPAPSIPLRRGAG